VYNEEKRKEGTSMGVEFELKFSADPAQQDAIRQQYLSTYEQFRMQTTYYDTPSAALSARHITLRCRMENEEAVCTVKTPLAGYGRGEWDCRCDDIHKAVPMLINAGAPEALLPLTAEGLIPVCGARFTRHAGTIAFAGATLEIALDTGILMGGGKELPLCEVEVELKSGEPEAAIAFGMELKQAFALEPQGKSKFRRALELTQGD
jgi:inorganic triphosphatase YgiF